MLQLDTIRFIEMQVLLTCGFSKSFPLLSALDTYSIFLGVDIGAFHA
jgi:hypothetical protein